jgi:hypothetical protein
LARILPLLTCLGGCHTFRFEVHDAPVAKTVYDRKAFFIGGLLPTNEIDLAAHCEHGVVRIREQTTFGDGFFNLISLGIYTPRSSWYECAAPTGEERS